MTTEVRMPDFGGEASEGTIVAWHKRAGDRVEQGEVIAEVMTDKVNIELESPAAGVIVEIVCEADELVASGVVIARVGAA